MKAFLPRKSIVGGISIQSTPSLHAILYANLNATKCKTLVKTKRNLKLYAITCVQTNNQNENHEATLPPCLNKALLFKVKKSKRSERKTKENDLTKLGAKWT